ncbi:MAG: hypothetical protein FJX77_12055, partial [Armatimonadetes bacterium]|nr:hypothetical protein [Armatimonadota bacterium]
TGDLEKDLTNRLKSQLRRPIVRVTLIEAYEPPRPEPMEPEPFRVTVLGAVEKPGELDLLKPKPLRTVLAELGITKDANLGEVQVLRPGANRALVFDYSQFAVSGDIRREGEVVEDYVLQGGEEVRVPARAPEPKQAVLRVEVLGRVGNPGPVELESGFSLLDALKKAGPAHPSADLTQVEISSSRGAQTVNLESFIAGNPASRYELRSGDRIVFKEKPTKVLVIGEVNQPNEYYIPDDATLLSIYTQAGAKNGNGDDKNIQILRSVAGKQEILKFNLQEIVSGKKENPRLKNGDVVFVPGRKSKRGALYYLNALSTPLFLFRGF